MRRKVLPGMMILMLFTSISHAGGPGTTNANFLKAGQGVRPIAMGETYIALGNGLDTLYWNPAGLVQLKSPEATFTHSFWVQEIGTEYLAFGTPLGPLGAIGGGITYMNAGTVTQTLEDENGNYIGIGSDVSAMSLAFIGTYSQKLSCLVPSKDPFVKNTLIGASLRIVTESIDDVSIFGGAVDIGAIWRQTQEIKPKDISTLNPLQQKISTIKPGVRDSGWRAGFVAQNLGMTTDQLMPINFRVGGGYLVNDVFTDNGQATFAVDVLIPVDNDVKISLGSEYVLITSASKFSVRVGYKIGNEIKDLDAMAGLTAGAGFSILTAGIRYQMDYAFVPYGDLGTTHRVSLTLGFLSGPNAVKPQALQPRAIIEHPKKVKEVTKEEALAMAAARKKKKEQEKQPKEKVEQTAAVSAPISAVKPRASVPTVISPPKTVDKTKTAKKLKKSLKRIMGSVKAGMLPSLEFDRGTADLTKKSKRTLEQIGKKMEKYKEGQVTIIGFAGSKSDLAQKRAESVLRYLKMNFRVNPEQLNIKAGEAGKKPKNSSIAFDVQVTE